MTRAKLKQNCVILVCSKAIGASPILYSLTHAQRSGGDRYTHYSKALGKESPSHSSLLLWSDMWCTARRDTASGFGHKCQRIQSHMYHTSVSEGLIYLRKTLHLALCGVCVCVCRGVVQIFISKINKCWCVCWCVSLFVCLSVWLSVCLFVSVCLPVSLCLFVCLFSLCVCLYVLNTKCP